MHEEKALALEEIVKYTEELLVRNSISFAEILGVSFNEENDWYSINIAIPFNLYSAENLHNKIGGKVVKYSKEKNINAFIYFLPAEIFKSSQ